MYDEMKTIDIGWGSIGRSRNFEKGGCSLSLMNTFDHRLVRKRGGGATIKIAKNDIFW